MERVMSLDNRRDVQGRVGLGHSSHTFTSGESKFFL